MIFSRQKKAQEAPGPTGGDFGYLDTSMVYLDAACQTLRPQCVIDAETDYYRHFNACGGRVQYGWGKKVDERVTSARRRVLAMLGKDEREYAVCFTLNTSMGINLVLHQLPATFARIVTSEIEHNSIFLPTITWAKRRAVPRLVLPRAEDGSLQYASNDLAQAVVLVNTTSNIDGRTLRNVRKLAEDVHTAGGVLLLDAAQTMGHDVRFLRDVPFDALFASGHKMYGPSLGIIVLRRSLLRSLDHFFLGGGTVTDVHGDAFTLHDGAQEHETLEIGLQNWGGIVGLDAALTWLEAVRPDGRSHYEHEVHLARQLFEGLSSMSQIRLINRQPSTVVAFSMEDLDSHRLAVYLDAQGILCRSGHFCCHHYLQHVRGLPAQLRMSIGLQTTSAQIERTLNVLHSIAQSL